SSSAADACISCNRLSEDNGTGIAAVLLMALKSALSDRGISLSWDYAVPGYLAEKSYSITYGARNLRRLIRREIEDVIAAKLVDEMKGKAKSVNISLAGEELSISAE
ncbi:MAG: ATP-dependent Clp protease ATP-binding subunit, partial [Oscillospiraceae bacterium]|nr:ATP-dependent Clp protease ATP-binding subunit [Oscillospiraceae bacterium]